MDKEEVLAEKLLFGEHFSEISCLVTISEGEFPPL